jgi:23S rRNA pseudouridine2605 synthase
MHSDIKRVYNIKISGSVTKEIIKAMKDGYFCKDATFGAHKNSKITSMEFKPFIDFEIIKNSKKFSKLKVTISEGKNRELRRFFGCFKREVLDLNRVEYGWIKLNSLPKGKWKFLDKKEYDKLHQFIKENYANTHI